MIHLIDPKLANCAPDLLPQLEGTSDSVIHRPDEQYRFLHDNAVVCHEGTFFAAWYNCPQHEIEEESRIRGRRSNDRGRTWSPVEVIAADREGKGIPGLLP